MINSSIPNKKNFCGGAFQDWLEVYLTGRCNGKCKWCIDSDGFRPKEKASIEKMVKAVCLTGRKNIVLLGGEPTLYKDLENFVVLLRERGKNVYLTSNGHILNDFNYFEKVKHLTGINFSIHHYDMDKNKNITGIGIKEKYIPSYVGSLHLYGVSVRLNCNIIKGYIDSYDEVMKYIDFAKSNGIDSVRFAELKNNEDEFVSLTDIFGEKYGLNEDPFVHGCHCETEEFGIRVSFRQMCGIQNSLRPVPKNPKLKEKQVLYYDGNIYRGWQSKIKEDTMSSEMTVKRIMGEFKDGKISADEAEKKILDACAEDKNDDVRWVNKFDNNIVGGCHY